MKYFVIATRWDAEKKQQVKYIAGEFSKCVNAAIFRDAYNEYWSEAAVVVEECELLNP